MNTLLKRLFSKNETSKNETLDDRIIETKELTHKELVSELRNLYLTSLAPWQNSNDFILKDNRVILKWKDYEQGKIKEKGIIKFHPGHFKTFWKSIGADYYTNADYYSSRRDNLSAHIHFIDVMHRPYKLQCAEKKFKCIKKLINQGDEIGYIYNYFSANYTSLDNELSLNEQSREELELKYTQIKK